MLIWRSLCAVQFFVVLIVFTYLGLTPHPENSVPMFNDKIMHSTGYFIAAFSISFAFPRWQFLYRAIFLIVFSICIEIGQHFLPPRTFDFYDICANSVGVITGLLVVTMLEIKLQWFKRFIHLSQQ